MGVLADEGAVEFEVAEPGVPVDDRPRDFAITDGGAGEDDRTVECGVGDVGVAEDVDVLTQFDVLERGVVVDEVPPVELPGDGFEVALGRPDVEPGLVELEGRDPFVIG